MAASSPILLIMATLATFGLMVASPCAAQSSLSSPHSLRSGQFLVSGVYRLTMQPDCNLVLKDRTVTIWQSGTALPPPLRNCRVKLENNGNLVIYDHTDHRIWQIGTNREIDFYVLVLQPDRNLAIYGPKVWATYTTIYTVGLHNSTATVGAAAEQVILRAVAGASDAQGMQQ